MCMSHSNGIDVFQPGGEGATLTAQVAETKVASGMQIHWPREVEVVSKTHILYFEFVAFEWGGVVVRK